MNSSVQNILAAGFMDFASFMKYLKRTGQTVEANSDSTEMKTFKIWIDGQPLKE